jgi:hypothetical protein
MHLRHVRFCDRRQLARFRDQFLKAARGGYEKNFAGVSPVF